MDDFLNSQKNILGISDFLKSAEKYTQNNFPDLNIDNLFSSAISGGIDTNFWTSNILNFARSRDKIGNSAYDYSAYCYNNT